MCRARSFFSNSSEAQFVTGAIQATRIVTGSARGLGVTMMMFLITSFGTVTTAAYGVGGNVMQFVVIPAMGFSMATSTLVGQNIGAGNIPRAEAVARLAALITFGALTAFGVFAFAFANLVSESREIRVSEVRVPVD